MSYSEVSSNNWLVASDKHVSYSDMKVQELAVWLGIQGVVTIFIGVFTIWLQFNRQLLIKGWFVLKDIRFPPKNVGFMIMYDITAMPTHA